MKHASKCTSGERLAVARARVLRVCLELRRALDPLDAASTQALAAAIGELEGATRADVAARRAARQLGELRKGEPGRALRAGKAGG